MPVVQWDKVKKAGIAPSPRTNFGLVTHKKRAILFGGITDQHGRGDRMYSSMHNELYQLNLETQRWYPVAVKAPAKAVAKTSSKATANAHSGGRHPPAGDALQSATTGDAVDDQKDAAGPHQATGSSRASDNVASTATPSQATAEQSDSHTDAASERQTEVAAQPDLANKLRDAGVDKSSALYKAAARIQSRFRGYTVRKVCLLHFLANLKLLAGKGYTP